MKDLYYSSLFFLFLVIIIPGLNSYIYSQEANEIYNSYYKNILNPKSSEDLFEAYVYFDDRIKNNHNEDDTLAILRDMRLLSLGQLDLGLYYECENTSIQALKYLSKLENNDLTSEHIVGFYNNLGRIYRKLNNFEVAIEYYNKALGFVNRTIDSIVVINNRANIRVDQKLFQQAISDLELIYQRSLEIDDLFQRARALDNLGFAQSNIDHPEGIKNMLSSLEMRLEIEDNQGTYASYFHLSKYYKDRNDKEYALLYANKAYETAKLINSPTYIENALMHLLELRDDEYITDYLRISDSIYNAKSIRDNKFASMKYNFMEEQKRATENELLIEKEKRKKIIYQALGLLVFISGIFLYFIFRSKFKKEKIEEIYKTETRISKKIHDEVANDIYQVMTKFQDDSSTTEEILDNIENVYVKTRDISKENSAIDVNNGYGDLLRDLIISYKNEDVTIMVKNLKNINWDHLPGFKKRSLYRVLQELMTNMRKHSNATHVAVSFNQKGKKYFIEYADNGTGCDLKKKMGLMNTENRMESIDGTISFESEINKGFKAKISI